MSKKLDSPLELTNPEALLIPPDPPPSTEEKSNLPEIPDPYIYYIGYEASGEFKGRITRSGTTIFGIKVPVDEGQKLLFLTEQFTSPHEDYYVAGDERLVKKQELSLLDNHIITVGENLSLPLPDIGFEITVDDETSLITDSLTFMIESDMPAEYTLVFKKWPYKDKTVLVKVVEEA